MAEKLTDIYPEPQESPRPLAVGDLVRGTMSGTDNTYILAKSFTEDRAGRSVVLVNLRTGERFGDPIGCRNPSSLCQEEVRQLFRPYYNRFARISRSDVFIDDLARDSVADVFKE